jgi:NarL family two-component system response regulator LiaR
LTARELEVLALVAEGRRNQEIADVLTLSHRTVERHLENIYAKMAVDTRTEAVVMAAQNGLLGTRNDTWSGGLSFR